MSAQHESSPQKPRHAPDAPQAEVPSGLKAGATGKTKIVKVVQGKKTPTAGSITPPTEQPDDAGENAVKMLRCVSTAVLAASIAIPLIAHACCNDSEGGGTDVPTKEEEGGPKGEGNDGSSLFNLLTGILSMSWLTRLFKSGGGKNGNDTDGDDDNDVSDYAKTQSL